MAGRIASKNGFLEISFAWLFALIVGAVILFLAIYTTTKVVKTEQTTIDAETAKRIGILLNPLETEFETGKTTSIILPSETKIYNGCNNIGIFGRQLIRISQKSFGKWTETDIDVGFSNKYLFSEEYAEGKKFYLFSKPFNFPFKVSDVIYLTSSLRKYCFMSAPEKIEEEISLLKQDNILLNECPDSENAVKVCFTSGGTCDIKINYGAKYVEKGGKIMHFSDDALMYGAIFADSEVYECQLKRLMQRVEQLSLLYKDKTILASKTGCGSAIKSDLLAFSNMAKNFESSANLDSISATAESINEKNEGSSQCRLW